MNNDVELIPVKGVLPSVQVQSDNVIYVPQAHKNKAGIVKEGDGVLIENGVVSLNKQTVEDMIDANKWVSYGFEQNLTEDEKGMARHNIGAGDNDFTGSWLDLANRPQQTVDFAEAERQKSKNLFNTTKAENVGYNWNGTLASNNSPNYISCGFIKIKPNTNYIFSLADSSMTMQYTGALFYTLDKTYISYVECNGNTFITPSNAEYMICQFWFESNPMNYKDIIQIEEGSVATSFQKFNGAITHNGNPTIVFAESERQKSKNLIPFPYIDGNSKTTNGITFTVNNNQSVSIVGSIINHDSNAVIYLVNDMPLKAGTYSIFCDSSNADISVVVWIGDFYYSGEFTLLSDSTATIYLQVSKYSTQTFDTSVKFMLCEGDRDSDWQPYNGPIVHEKQIEITIGNATLNTDFVSSGEVSWVKLGKLVVVSFSDLKFKGSIAHQNLYFSGLPKKAIKAQTFLLYQMNAHGGSSIRCMMHKDSTQIVNWYQDTTVDTNAQYYGQFTYITE